MMNNYLLVEGPDDMHTILALCKHYDVPETFSIIPCEGIDHLLENLRLRLKTAKNNRIVGIVMDADVNIEGRWASILNILKETNYYDCSGLTLPSEGMILSPLKPEHTKVGLWLMPNNSSSGMLEDFAMSLARPDDPLLLEAEEELQRIEAKGIQGYRPVQRSKAKVHTYISWQDHPGLPLGAAITARVLNPEAPTARLFTQWLKELFTDKNGKMQK